MAEGMAVLHGMAEKLLRGGLYQWVSPHRCRGAIHWEVLGLGACEMLGQVLLEPGAGDATLCVGLPPSVWGSHRCRGRRPGGGSLDSSPMDPRPVYVRCSEGMQRAAAWAGVRG